MRRPSDEVRKRRCADCETGEVRMPSCRPLAALPAQKPQLPASASWAVIALSQEVLA